MELEALIEAARRRAEEIERGAFSVARSPEEVARMIDHTLLKPQARRADVLRLVEEAKTYGFFGVCVNPVWVPFVAQALRGREIRVVTVAGFPLGANTSRAKAQEAAEAVAQGAHEVDMVMAIGHLKDRDYTYVKRDIRAVVEAAAPAGVKVILETGLLTDEEKVIGAQLAAEAGAAFVKTSTGFGPSGATVYDVALLSLAVGEGVGVKAAGGIRTWDQALKLIAAGATRLGASRSVEILKAASPGSAASGGGPER